MFVIFGWPKLTSGRQSLGVYCSACQRDTVHKAFTQQSWFSLFFIPIIPIGAKQPHAICNICGRDAHDPTSTRAALQCIRAEVSPSVVGASPFLVGSGATRPSRRCPACAEDILLEAIVCRFCGHSLSAEEVARAVQDRDRQIQAAAAAAQQAELARQQQRHIKRLRGRRTRRLVFGGILTWVGGWMLITMTAMFFSSPAAGNSANQQRIAAATVGFLFGLVPLAGGIALLLAARSAKRLLIAEQTSPFKSAAIPNPNRKSGQNDLMAGSDSVAAQMQAVAARNRGNT